MLKNYMMLQTKSPLITVSALAISISLAGCGKTENTSHQPAANASNTASAQLATLEQNNKAAKTGAAVTVDNFVSKLPETAPVYKVATTGTMAPFSFKNEKGKLQGFDIDAIREIGEAGGFKVEFFIQPFQNIFPTVESGKYDLGVSAISFTDERQGKYNLSNSYFFNPSAMMYKVGGKPATTLADLVDRKVAGMTGTKQIAQVQAATKSADIGSFATTFLLFQGLVQGKADVIVQDEPFLRYTANNFPEQKVVIVPYESKDDPIAQQVIVMRKGNDALTAKVNKGIETLKANGKLKQLEEKWFGKQP